MDIATFWHRHSPETSDISQKAPQRQEDFLGRCRRASSHWDDILSRCPQCQGRQTSYRRACPAAGSIRHREKTRETLNLSEVLDAKYKPVLFSVIINRLIHDSHCTQPRLISFHSLLPLGRLPPPSVLYPLLRAGSLLAALSFPLQLPSSHSDVGFICAWWIHPRCPRQPFAMALAALQDPSLLLVGPAGEDLQLCSGAPARGRSCSSSELHT